MIMERKTFIIAEAGVNHNGRLDIAKKMIDAASDAGADAVKFQTFKAEDVISKYAPKADYQTNSTDKIESQLEMVKKLELDGKEHRILIEYCHRRKIMFLSTPFDFGSIRLLNRLGLTIFKVPSGEITNLPFLRKVGSLRKKVILSTGMSNLGEIEDALDVLTRAGTDKKDLTVLHCNTEYPTPKGDVNLRAMMSIREAFKVKVGYSDHTLGIEVPVAAAALGAAVIEKHFTLDKKMHGPDHKASLEPSELKTMIEAIRNVEKALGDGIKRVSPSEMKNRAIARKSIVASKNIRKDEILSEKNITAKRPGTGISPMQWDEVIGMVAKRNFTIDELIEL